MNEDDKKAMIAKLAFLLKGMSPEEKEEMFRKAMEEFVEGEAKLGLDLPDGLSGSWEIFYRDLFGWELDFSTIVIPEPKQGFNRLLMVPQILTTERLYAKCVKLFPCWKYADNLDSITSDRGFDKLTASDPASTYAIWVRDCVEADEELKNKSANMLAESGIKGMTLPERLLYELKYFTETKKHLDVKNFTLCIGSRDPDGRVPYVHWNAEYGKMYVHWFYPDYGGDYLRARAVIA